MPSGHLKAVRQPHDSNAVLYTILCAAAVPLLFINAYFIYYGVIKTYSTTADYYLASFADLVQGAGFGIVLWLAVISPLAVLLICEWIRFFTGKKVRIVPVVCSGISFVTVVLSSIIGTKAYNVSYSDYSASLKKTIHIERTFISFQALFYVELALFLLFFIISLLSEKGIIFFKRKRRNKRPDTKSPEDAVFL